LRVIDGKASLRPTLGMWIVFSGLAIALFFALIMSRVALDKPALELSDLTKQISTEQAHYQQLRLDVARLQAPDRIVPLAEDLGLTYPDHVKVVIADGVGDQTTEDGFVDAKSILTASP
jgi:hypothetical protein